MKRIRDFILCVGFLGLVVASLACGTIGEVPLIDKGDGGLTLSSPPPVNDPSSPDAGDGGEPTDGGHRTDGGTVAPSCKKHITVIFSVGTGAGSVASLSNGCWTVIDADGAANPQFRKCSTSNYVVQYPRAPNYGYDDTSPQHVLSKETQFLSQCAAGATGSGYEYLANRGGWRVLNAPHLKAWFAELYTTDLAVADSYSLWTTPLGGHVISPMINIGPNQASVIQTYGLKMCNRVAANGYFGVYNGDWRGSMTPKDARAIALAKALNQCTHL